MSARWRYAVPLLLLALGGIGPAVAAEVRCVGSPEEFSAALGEAGSSALPGDFDIRLREGTYPTIAANGMYGFLANMVVARALSISGGWSGVNCDAQGFGAAKTLIDGRGVQGGLAIGVHVPVASITLSNLAIANAMVASAQRSAALEIKAGGIATAIKVQNAIFANNGDGGASDAVEMRSGGPIVVRNSVFVGNIGRQIGALGLYGEAAQVSVGNNTFVGNRTTDANTSYVLWCANNGAAPPAMVDNNVFWDNDGAAVPRFDASCSMVARNNLIDQVAPASYQPGSQGNQFGDPHFVSLGDLRVNANSPARNTGYANPGAGVTGVDVAGRPRVQEGAIDRGAHESDVLFANGFDPF